MITSLKKDALPTIFPENAFGVNPPKKRVRVSAPVVRPWADTSDTDIPTSIVMGIPLKIVKIEEDPLEASTSCSVYPEEKPPLSGWMSMKKKKPGQGISPVKTSMNIIELAVPKETRTVGTNTEYFPGQRHKSSGTDPNFRMKHKEVQTKKSKCIKCHCNSQPELRLSRPDTSPSSSRAPPRCGLSPSTFPDGQDLSPGGTTVSLPITTKSFRDHLANQEVKKTDNGLVGVSKVNPEGVDRTGTEEAFSPRDPFSENKYIVFDSCLNKLLRSCRCLAEDDCDGRITRYKKFLHGSSLSVKAECSRGHTFHMWDSHP